MERQRIDFKRIRLEERKQSKRERIWRLKEKRDEKELKINIWKEKIERAESMIEKIDEEIQKWQDEIEGKISEPEDEKEIPVCFRPGFLCKEENIPWEWKQKLKKFQPKKKEESESDLTESQAPQSGDEEHEDCLDCSSGNICDWHNPNCNR